MEFFVAVGEAYAGWGARVDLAGPGHAGAQVIRRALAEQFNKTNQINAPLFHGLLADLEAATRGPDAALTLIDQGLAAAQETGEHYTDPYLYRLRGEVLFRRDPRQPCPRRRGLPDRPCHREPTGRTQLPTAWHPFLSPNSTNRPAALPKPTPSSRPPSKVFSPTREMPEIAEAQALLSGDRGRRA